MVLSLQQVLLLPSDLACLQSPGRRETLKNSVCIGFIMDMSNFCFKACLQLVKVSTVLLIFVGRGLFVKIQSLKETSTSLRSAQVNILLICTIEIVFSVSHSFTIHFTASLLQKGSVQFVVSTWKRPVCEKYRVPRCLEQQKIPHT